MDATQQIEDSFLGEEDDSDNEPDQAEGKSEREPLAVLKVFKNNHIPETEVPLYQGENVLGRDPTSCSVPLQTRSVSGHHAIISISVFGPNDHRAHSEATEALLWDLGSLNGTRKGRFKLTPHVRYALTDGDVVVLADLPCQYVSLKNAEKNTHTSTGEKNRGQMSSSSSTKGVENSGKKSALPPVPVWSNEAKSPQQHQLTPKQPETTLVPESDSDSDGEKQGRRERKRIMALDSVSSDLSSPTYSTFLSPATKIIPESEDESAITPSPALKGRFQKPGNDTEVSSGSSKPDPLTHFNMDSDTDDEDEDAEITKAVVPAEAAAVNPADLHMDSDTDAEEEEMEKVKSDPEASGLAPAKPDLVNPAALNMNSDTDNEDAEITKAVVPAEAAAVNPADLHMDSDTDAEEEEMEKVKSDPEASGLAPAKPDLVNPAALNMNSDTDVEEDEPVKTDAVSSSGPVLEEKKDADQFHFESATNVEEEEEVSHIQVSKPRSSPVAEFNMNSDTDIEEEEETTKAVLQPHETDNKVPDAQMLPPKSDSDTDVEDEVTDIRTPTVAKETGNSETAVERSTGTLHYSPNGAQLPAEALRDEFRLESDTDVEEDEDKMDEKEQKCAEAAVRIVHSSTPRGAGLSEEEKVTQAFLSPSQLFKRPGLPSILHPSVSPGGASHTDDDFAVAETQSFMCDAGQADATLDETPQSLDDFEPQRSGRAPSFQLDLSDSSTTQMTEAEELNREPAEEDWELQATQLYAMKNLEGSTKTGKTLLDLDATQAFTDSISRKDKEDGTKDEEEEEEETQPQAAPSHSSINSETLLIKPRAQNENPSERDSIEKLGTREPETKNEKDVHDDMPADSHLSTADTLLIVRSPRQEEQTHPYAFLVEKIQETEKKEHESRDQEVQQIDEGQRAQHGMMGHENNEEREMKEHEPTSDGLEDEKKEGDEDESENKVEARTQPAEDDTVIETQPMCEEKDEEGHEEEQLNEPSTSKGTCSAQVESAQCIKAEHHTRAAVAIAETQAICEEEEEQEEEENEIKNSKRPCRRRQSAKVATKQSDKLTHVTIAETLPLCEEDNERQEEQREAICTKRSSMRRQNVKAKPTKSDKCHVTIPETLPMYDEAEGQEEEPQSEAKSVRKSRRGKQTAKVEATQPLDADFTVETLKTEKEQDGRRSLRRRATSGKSRGRGRAAAEKDRRGKKGKTEQDKDCEEEVNGGNKAKNEEIERLKKQEDEEESEKLQKEKEEETRAQLEREKSMRLEKERKEREESEKREQEEKDRLERERIDQEKKAIEEKERIEREIKEKEEKEKFEREKQLEKERREHEKKDKLEQERIERENKEKEKKEKLEKDKQEEKDRLGRETRDREEKKMRKENEKQEKEIKGNEDRVEREQRQAPGRRKTVRKGGKIKNEEEPDVEEKTKERQESEQELSEKQNKECEEGSSKKQEEEAECYVKPRRGRRTARKFVAPPAGVEDEGGPAKRTRSRSNSSNSVCSEQSTQDSLNEGRRRGRRTTTVIPSEKEDTKQAAYSRSNSISSERSSGSLATRSRGRGAKSRKIVKVEEPEEEKPEERKRSTAVGRGRGRDGKRPGTNEIKAEAAGEAEKEEAEISAVAAEDSVMNQSSSRGRKRGVDISRAETQPVPKTPRRSITGPTHKVLFTGVADEDCKTVVVRLGGGLAKGVNDMTHLVTDKVRRTVKFLCAVARGVPIVTPDWLSKCGKEGSFLSPNGFQVKDVEQEKRFNFSLKDALRVASSQPLLQGYEIHVTPSVKPEPAQIKDIITCCGARFLPKMPSAHKAQVVVVSCEEDRAVCERAQSLSFPVVSAEFLLTGILQQKVDVQTHALSLSPAASVPKPNARRRGK